MKVYRIEDKTGWGPFQTGLAKPEHYEPPGPASDGVFGSIEEYFELLHHNYDEMIAHNYGFQTKTKLKQWFNKSDLRAFERAGTYVYEYSVPDGKVKEGGHQCAFKKTDAYSYRKVPVKKLLH